VYVVISGILVGLLVLWAAYTFNRFVQRSNLLKEAWSGIDVQLRRRYNLIPNLVSTVKGYGRHERKLFEEITEKRSKCMATGNVKEKSQAENDLSSSIKTLFAVAEGYPDLKANQNFLDLQNELSEIEDQIQLARRYYNGTVRNYNILVESFPSLLIAKALGFAGADFFRIEYATERQVPDIDL